jgi:hypothetical protein
MAKLTLQTAAQRIRNGDNIGDEEKIEAPSSSSRPIF